MSGHGANVSRDDELAEPRFAPLAQGIAIFGTIGVALLVIPIMLTCADIIWRRVIGGAFIDTFDITKLSLVAVAAWTIPYGFVHGSHVTVDLIVERFPARFQLLIDGLIHAASALLFVFLGWMALDAAMLHYSYHDTTQNLELPVVYYWAVFILGLALAALACLWRSYNAFRRMGGQSGVKSR